jgi:hypothetical protein
MVELKCHTCKSYRIWAGGVERDDYQHEAGAVREPKLCTEGTK